MAKVIVALSMSPDGYIAGPDDGDQLPLGQGGTALLEWYFTGDTPSQHYERFRLSGPSAQVFDEEVSSAGAVVTGRRLRAGLLDEIDVAVVPLLPGGGVRQFDHLGGPVPLGILRVVDAPGVTHLRYRVVRGS
jgi:hypothetical protein